MIVIKSLDCPNRAPSERDERDGPGERDCTRSVRTFAGRPLISGYPQSRTI